MYTRGGDSVVLWHCMSLSQLTLNITCIPYNEDGVTPDSYKGIKIIDPMHMHPVMEAGNAGPSVIQLHATDSLAHWKPHLPSHTF